MESKWTRLALVEHIAPTAYEVEALRAAREGLRFVVGLM